MSGIADLSSRVALVTGGSRGIGRAIAAALARAGATVAINYRSRAPEPGPHAMAVQADVSIAAEVERMAQTVGRVDILVNNAGIARPQPMDQIAEADWDDVLR